MAVEVTSAQVRNKLEEALKLDLVGPEAGLGDPAETLSQAPSRWYLTGFLAPLDAPAEQRSTPRLTMIWIPAVSTALGSTTTWSLSMPRLLSRSICPVQSESASFCHTKQRTSTSTSAGGTISAKLTLPAGAWTRERDAKRRCRWIFPTNLDRPKETKVPTAQVFASH